MSPSVTCTFVARNIYINGEKTVISAKLPIRIFDKQFHVSPLGSLASADVEAPGNESWDY